jgi:hypothetical protein
MSDPFPPYRIFHPRALAQEPAPDLAGLAAQLHALRAGRGLRFAPKFDTWENAEGMRTILEVTIKDAAEPIVLWVSTVNEDVAALREAMTASMPVRAAA